MFLIDPWRQKGAAFVWQPHQILWLQAANTLPKGARLLAYRDIGLLTGADWDQLRGKAYRLRANARMVAPPASSPESALSLPA